MIIAVIIASFLTAFLGIFTVNLILVDIFQRDREATLERLNKELMDQHRQRAREAVKNVKKSSVDDIIDEAARESQERKGVLQRIEEITLQSGLNITTPKLMLTALLVGAATTGLVALLYPNMMVAGAAGGVAAAIPFLYVSFARKRRMEKLRSQLPDALELMSRVLRAGQSIPQAMKAVSEEFKAPISMEFGYCYEQQNLGLAPDVALRELAQRTGMLEVKIFVLAILVHRQSGGNLTELLDNIARVVRQRFRMRTEIKSLTAEGRFQAIILLALPVLLWFGLFLIAQDYALELFDHSVLVLTTLAAMVAGAFWIRRIVNFDF